ncbi:MAG: DUF58 domain-containing protein [Gammaproteobacteria bacterium]|nr:DUF58 domain-containing protein [Gammaproteobacteria bacterium]
MSAFYPDKGGKQQGAERAGDGLIFSSLNSLIDLRYAAERLPKRLPSRYSSQSGHYVSNYQGRGMEFAESRPYSAGDDIRSIDWKITARTGEAYTKLFREERERSIILGVDLQQSMHFATRGAFKAVVGSQIAALLAWRALHQGDRLGGMVFSESGHFEVRPQLGRSAVLQFLYQVANHEAWDQHRTRAEQAVAGGSPFSHLVKRLRRVSHPGAQVIIIGDFMTISAGDERQLREISRHCELALIFIYDPFEEALPTHGRYSVSDGENSLQFDVGSAPLRQRYHEQFEARLDYLETIASRYHLRLLLCRTDEDPASTLSSICAAKRQGYGG